MPSSSSDMGMKLIAQFALATLVFRRPDGLPCTGRDLVVEILSSESIPSQERSQLTIMQEAGNGRLCLVCRRSVSGGAGFLRALQV